MLVTGAAGFTGRALVQLLVDSGARPRALLRPSGSTAEFAPGVEVVHLDLRDAQACVAAVADIDIVFHVAAVFRTVGVTLDELQASHVRATEHLLHASQQAGIKRFVHVSTIGVQGPNPEPLASEESRAAPNDDYQLTKYCGEQRALELSSELGLATTVVRPCAIYGAGDDRFLKIIKPIARGRFPMIGRGEGRFHLVHVRDLVRGMLLAAQTDKAVGQVVTLGGREVPTLAEFVALIARHTGGRALPVSIPYGPVYALGYLCEKVSGYLGVEPPLHRRRVKFFGSDRHFDLTRARELLGYVGEVSLDEGVAELVQWHRQRGDI